jgi:hypothetical protein
VFAETDFNGNYLDVRKAGSVEIRIEEVTATLDSIHHTLEQSKQQIEQTKTMLDKLKDRAARNDAAIVARKSNVFPI